MEYLFLLAFLPSHHHGAAALVVEHHRAAFPFIEVTGGNLTQVDEGERETIADGCPELFL